MNRINYIPAPQYFNLNLACLALNEAFGLGNTFLVGSSLLKRDYRDVDVRTILDDEEYNRLFPNLKGNPAVNGLWALTCSAISGWLSERSGLPVDFQIQMQTEANTENDGMRSALGMFLVPPAALAEQAAPVKEGV